MSEATPGNQNQGCARDENSGLSRNPGDNKNIRPGSFVREISGTFEKGASASEQSRKHDNRIAGAQSASFVVHPRGQESTGNGQKGTLSGGCEASDMHADQTNQTAMQGKNGSSGNLHDPGIKEVTVTAEGLHVVHPRGQESTGNGPKGTQSGGREASDMHADQTNQTAMQGKTGSSGNLHDPGIKEVTVTAEESVVELQQVNHHFYEKDDMIVLDMYVNEVDKDSLMVIYFPDSLHVRFQTRDAQFLNLYKGSTKETKFSWTIKLKGQLLGDKGWGDVNPSVVSLKFTKKVSGGCGEQENSKRTGEGRTDAKKILPETPKTDKPNTHTRNQDMKPEEGLSGGDRDKAKGAEASTKHSRSDLPDMRQNQSQDTTDEKDRNGLEKELKPETKEEEGREEHPKPTSEKPSGSDVMPSSLSTNPGTTGGRTGDSTDQPDAEAEETQGSGVNQSDERASKQQNNSRNKPDDASARQRQGPGDGGDGGQASPSDNPGSTGDSHDGSTEQPGKPPVTGTGHETESEETQGSGVNRSDEMAGKQQNNSPSNVDDASTRQHQGPGDGGDGGQASPSPGSTGGSHDGSTEQPGKPPVTGTGHETESEETQGSGVNRSDEMAGKQQNNSPSNNDDASTRQHQGPGDRGDGGQASPNYNSGSTGDSHDGSTEKPGTPPVTKTGEGASEQDDVPPSLPPKNKERKNKNANKETDSKTQGNLMEKSPKAPPRTRKLQKDEIFANSQTTNTLGTLDTGKENAGNVVNESLPKRTECVSNVEDELDEGCRDYNNTNDEANQAKHNAPGSQTDFQYGNNTHTAVDSENKSSANVVSSDRASEKQTVEIKQGFSQGPSFQSTCSSKDAQIHSSERSDTNGIYTFAKDGGEWCIFDAKSGELLTIIKNVITSDIHFRGKHRVYVDDESYAIRKLEDGQVELKPVHEQTPLSKKDKSQLQATQNSQRTTPANFQSSLKNGTEDQFHKTLTVHVAFYEVLKKKMLHMEFAVDDEKDICTCTLFGDKEKVEEMIKQVHSIETSFTKNEVSFKEIKQCNVDEEGRNLHEFFEYQNATGTNTYFYVNSKKRKVYILSENQEIVDAASNLVKKLNVKRLNFANTSETQEGKERFEDNVLVLSRAGETIFIGLKADIEKCISKSKPMTKSVEITSEESFKLLCQFGLQNMIEFDTVTIESRSSSYKHGFVLTSTSEESLYAAETCLKEFEQTICQEVICISSDHFHEQDWSGISKQLFDTNRVVADIMDVSQVCTGEKRHFFEKENSVCNWNFSKGNTLKMSNRDPKQAWENMLLYPVPEQYFAEEKAESKHLKRRINILIYSNKKVWKQKHRMNESIQHGLSEASKKSHVCIPIGDHKQYEIDVDKLVKNLLFIIQRHFENTESLAVELCIADKEIFTKCICCADDFLKDIAKKCMHSKHLYLCQRPVRCRILKGMVHEQQVGVIVNSTSNDLRLDAGFVSKHILDAAGPEIQKEISKKYSRAISDWHIAVTDGYKLPCKKVFHGAPSLFAGHQTFEIQL